ncbi:MAG: hypothetical protein WBA93_00190 [Microcoleaceae cyanobacterium]
MARYTGLFTVAVDVENMPLILTEMLDYCGCKMVYNRGYYLMASEIPGQVSVSQLVTIEITLETANTTTEKKRINLVVQNEELPFKSDNHCRKIFVLLSRLIAGNPNWKLLSSIF